MIIALNISGLSTEIKTDYKINKNQLGNSLEETHLHYKDRDRLKVNKEKISKTERWIPDTVSSDHPEATSAFQLKISKMQLYLFLSLIFSESLNIYS